MKKRTAIIIGVVVVIVGGAGVYVAKRLSAGGEVTEVGIERVLETFRATVSTTSTNPSTTVPPTASTDPSRTTTSTLPPPALPALGVYQYATTGFDAVDVLTGARHEYPAVTTITVTPEGCGVRLRWDVAVERWATWDWCLDGAAVRLDGWSGHHEFFDVAATNDYVCSGEPRPLDAEPGTTWQMVCRIEDRDTSTYTGTVMARTSVTIGGVAVPALHVRYDVVVEGVSTGTQTIEGWYRLTDGLPLRETTTTNTSQDTPVGRSGFEERSTIELMSLTPMS